MERIDVGVEERGVNPAADLNIQLNVATLAREKVFMFVRGRGAFCFYSKR